MSWVRVDLVGETAMLDLQEGEGPRSHCGLRQHTIGQMGGGLVTEEKVCPSVACICALACEVQKPS